MNLQAIVFDYDGVIADTEPLHLRAFQETLMMRGVDLTRAKYFEDYLGLDDEGVFQAVSADQGLWWPRSEIRALVAEKADRFRDLSVTERLLFPGAAERLREWSRVVPIAIASGSLRHEIEAVLAGASLLDVVPVIVAAGEIVNGKPAPDPYLQALELLAHARGGLPLDAALCVAIEDSAWGIDSAHAAGMKAVGLATSYPAERLAAAEAVRPDISHLDLELLETVVCLSDPGRR